MHAGVLETAGKLVIVDLPSDLAADSVGQQSELQHWLWHTADGGNYSKLL